MKAISESKYEHLYRSLEELRYLMTDLSDTEPELITEINGKMKELEEKFKGYQSLLNQLESVTKDYDDFVKDIKTNLLGKHLKELQKTVKPGYPGYGHLYLGVQYLYGT